jgi:hypothetical protein
MDSITLEKYQLAVRLSVIAPENIKFKSYLDPMFDNMIYQLNAIVAGESLKKVEKVFPENWKEALKDRFLPLFLRKWFPVRYIHIDIEVAALYPKFVLPESQYRPVRIAYMDRSYNYTDSGSKYE